METEAAAREQAARRFRDRTFVKHLAAYSGYYFLAFTLLLFLLMRVLPALGEAWYARFFFPAIRAVMDSTIGRIPYLFFALMMSGFLGALYLLRGRRWQVLAVMLALFFWLFGFNYASLPLLKPIQVEAHDAASLADFQQRVCDSLVRYAALVPENVDEHPPLMNAALVQAMRESIAPYDRPVWGNPRVQLIAAHSGWLSRCGIAGIYFPYALSGFCDATFIPPVRHFVMAHEMAHACSVAPEHEADYFGFQALLRYHGSNEAVCAARYAAYLQLYRSTRRALLAADSLRAENLEHQLPPSVQQHLHLARAHAQQYPEFIAGAQDRANQAYLKSLGQTHGTEQYHWLVYTVKEDWTR